MGKHAFSQGKTKWLLLFFSLFACVFGCFSGVLFSPTAVGVYADTVSAVYTVTSTSAVSTSGTLPSGSSASYASTYTDKCQLTADNSMALTLSGYDGATITGLTLSMKSNSKSGKGSMSMTIGDSTVASIADSKFNAGTWYGDWSTSYVDVSPTVASTVVGTDEQIVITIAASANSLYCQSFTVSYTPKAAESSSSSEASSSSSEESSEASSYSSLPEIVISGTDASSYYSSLVAADYLKGKNGQDLADDIHKVMWATTTSRRSYAKLASDHLPISDADPSNSAYLIDFWTGEPLLISAGSSVWNLEHVWPAANSYGAWQRMDGNDKAERYAGCDIHHIRPSASTVNTTRGDGALGIVDTTQSFEYVTVNGKTSSCKDGVNSEGYSVFEPGDDKKGDIARIFFYLYVTYSTTLEIGGSRNGLTDCTSYDSDYSNRVSDLSKVIIDGDSLTKYGVHVDSDASLVDIRGTEYSSTIEMLLAWNELDPVDDLESQRNDYAAGTQGNRNPFIDFPDIANYIFDDQGQTFYDMEMDAEQTVLLSDGTFEATTRTMPASMLSSVTYTSSDSSIFSVSGSTFTVHAVGSARLTGTLVFSESLTITRTTTVRVVSSITGITLSPSTSSSNRYSLTVGKTFTPTANAVPSDAYDQGVTWASDDTTIATVNSETGKIKAVAAGDCIITVTSTADNSVYSTFYLTVVDAEAGVVDIEIDSFDMTGDTGYADRTWESGAFSGTGKIYKSTSVIQMYKSGGSYIYNSVADEPIEKIIFYSSPTEASTASDYVVYGATSAMTDSTYSSVGTLIDTVTCPTYGGSVSCELGGSYTYFYITTSGSYAHYLSRIRLIYGDYTPVLESISLDYSEMVRDYVTGDTLELSGLVVSAVYDDGTSSDVTASCAFSPDEGDTLDTTDASVTVSYTSGSLTLSDDVPISVEAPRVLSSVAITPATVSVTAGRKTSLRMKATYTDGSTATVTPFATWTSDDTTLATVNSSGVVSAIGPGEVTVTGSFTYVGVTCNSSCDITISESSFVVSATSFTCLFGDDSFTPTLTATYGEEDVTASCTYSETITSNGVYVYNKTLGEHQFTLSYTAGTTTYQRTITIDTTNAGASDPTSITYTLITDVSQLSAGNTYIIATTLDGSTPTSTLDEETSVVLGPQTYENYRSITTLGAADMALLTLGGSSGSWTLNDGTGYLALPSDNNYLKTADDTTNGLWTIAIDESTSIATITPTGYTSRRIQYNSNSNQWRFACYSSDQKGVYLYEIEQGGYSTSEQATALKNYLDGFKTCDVVEEADVRRLALEYNTLSYTTVGGTTSKAVFQGLYTSAQYVYGTDYSDGVYTGGPSGEAILCREKLEYIVARWNTDNPSNLVYLYDSAYYAGTDNGGSGGSAPVLAASTYAIRANKESSPLTATLWIVIGSGLAGLGAIGIAYWVSKKKKHQA